MMNNGGEIREGKLMYNRGMSNGGTNAGCSS